MTSFTFLFILKNSDSKQDIISGFHTNFLSISFYSALIIYLLTFLTSKNPLKEYFYNLFLFIMWWLSEAVGFFLYGEIIWNKFLIIKWESVVFFLQLYEFARREIYKFLYWLLKIEPSWRFIRILKYILQQNHSQFIFLGYIHGVPKKLYTH